MQPCPCGHLSDPRHACTCNRELLPRPWLLHGRSARNRRTAYAWAIATHDPSSFFCVRARLRRNSALWISSRPTRSNNSTTTLSDSDILLGSWSCEQKKNPATRSANSTVFLSLTSTASVSAIATVFRRRCSIVSLCRCLLWRWAGRHHRSCRGHAWRPAVVTARAIISGRGREQWQVPDRVQEAC